MIGLNTAAIYILQTLGSLYLLIVLLRFILQLVRADFYNPLSQFIVRATKPLLNPLRRIIPGFGGIDLASLVLAILIQLVLMILILMLMGYGVGGFIMQLLIWSIIAVTSLFLKVFFFALIISVILSWVAPGSYNPGAQLVNQICEPLLMPFRKLLPNLGGLDLSPIFAFLALKLIDMLVINNLAAMTGMPQQLSISSELLPLGRRGPAPRLPPAAQGEPRRVRRAARRAPEDPPHRTAGGGQGQRPSAGLPRQGLRRGQEPGESRKRRAEPAETGAHPPSDPIAGGTGDRRSTRLTDLTCRNVKQAN